MLERKKKRESVFITKRGIGDIEQAVLHGTWGMERDDGGEKLGYRYCEYFLFSFFFFF